MYLAPYFNDPTLHVRMHVHPFAPSVLPHRPRGVQPLLRGPARRVEPPRAAARGGLTA